MEIYLTELDNESPRLVRLIMKSVYENDKRRIRHIGCKRFGIQYLLKGLYTHNDLLYFHTQVKNSSNVPFDVDFITFKVVDKKVMKRTAMQEQVIYPLRAYNYVTCVNGRDSECTVFALPKFTIPDDKKLVVEMYEKQAAVTRVLRWSTKTGACGNHQRTEGTMRTKYCICWHCCLSFPWDRQKPSGFCQGCRVWKCVEV